MVLDSIPRDASHTSSTAEFEDKPIEVQQEQPDTHDSFPIVDTTDSKFAKRILRKVDFRVLPIFGIVYTVAYVDRANISVARVAGIDEELDLDPGSRASIALLVFFIGYIIFEIPGNILIKRGAVTIGQGFVDSWVSLSVLRAFLGAFEAGLYPGFVYIITCWYTRYEVQKRLAIFYFLAQGLSSFGRAVSVVLEIFSWFIIVDFPNSKRIEFLNEKEKSFVIQRLEDDGGEEDKSPVTWATIWKTCQDWQIWSYSFMYMTGAIGGYSFTLFLPIILEDSLGFSQELSFILSTPPIIFAVLVGGFISWLAGETRLRGPFIIVLGIFALVGFCMMGFLSNATARYVGVFIGEAGVQNFVVTSLAWQANNIRGEAKRAVATAFIVMASGISGIYSSLVFRQQNAPRYIPGVIAVLAPSVVTIILAVLTSLILKRRIKEVDKEKIIIEGSETFRYTL
ncbi:MFS general substrate transporter [Stipitochalara longipes BDJ]|nr:MFS general substrate transporter [Stipitochalara longipes BDJ]